MKVFFFSYERLQKFDKLSEKLELQFYLLGTRHVAASYFPGATLGPTDVVLISPFFRPVSVPNFQMGRCLKKTEKKLLEIATSLMKLLLDLKFFLQMIIK